MNDKNMNDNNTGRRKILSFLTPQGPILKVPVDDNNPPQCVIVEGNIWHELIALGMYPKLSVRDNQVMTWFPKPRRYYPLACLIADATTEDSVYPKDGNIFNMRSENIAVETPPRPVDRYRDMLDPAYGRAAILVEYELVLHAGL